MNVREFQDSLAEPVPPSGLGRDVEALWWDAKGDWKRAHGLVDELETTDAMAVHAYLHRKEGQESNANYWYTRAGEEYRRSSLTDEWSALLEGLLK